jgi:hypothetical protein
MNPRKNKHLCYLWLTEVEIKKLSDSLQQGSDLVTQEILIAAKERKDLVIPEIKLGQPSVPKERKWK